MSDEIDRAFERVRRLAEEAGLPGLGVGTSYGTPALLAGTKSFVRMKDAQTLVVMCGLDEKAMLIEAAPDLYFETDHYRGWPAMLVRLGAITDVELSQRLVAAWREKAGKRLRAQYESATGPVRR